MKNYLLLLILTCVTISCNNNTNGWSAIDKNEFINTCVQAATPNMGEQVAKSYCSCMQQKLEKKYPNSKDANKVTGEMQTPEMQAMVQECLGMGGNTNINKNNNNVNNPVGNPLGNNNENNNNNQAGGWTQAQFQQFVQGCSTTAQQQQGMTVMEANAYCSCMTTKVAQQYTFEQASQLTSADFQTPEWQQAKIDCGARRQ